MTNNEQCIFNRFHGILNQIQISAISLMDIVILITWRDSVRRVKFSIRFDIKYLIKIENGLLVRRVIIPKILSKIL